MKVKIGKKIYDAEKEPIMLILNKDDKYNISNMRESDMKYCCYPDGSMSQAMVEEFMRECDDML